MPFYLIKHIDGGINALEHSYLMKDGEGVKIGDALKLDSAGRLTKVSATDIPEFVSNRTQTSESPSRTAIPVIRVTEADEFETNASATIAQSLVGSKVTIGSDAASVTATTTGGVFTLSATDGDKKVRGFFRR
ncbi:hypothetical protein [Bacillus infantis]|uniref:hypothetical protein n=1 Tax=Bacillus infantis TaxID=324767 RepID=UPI003CE6DB57